MHALLLGLSLISVVHAHQHFLLHLKFTPVGDHPSLQFRLRYDEASFRIRMGKEILVYLDTYPVKWTGLIETAHGETTELLLHPRRMKTTEKVMVIDTELELYYYLSCEPNFYGPSCTKRCFPHENGGHYNCSVSGEKRCHVGWMGADCDIEVVRCAFSPCRNNATCLQLSSRQFQCLCSEGFEGTLCDRNVSSETTTSFAPTSMSPTAVVEPQTTKTPTTSATRPRPTPALIPRTKTDVQPQKREESSTIAILITVLSILASLVVLTVIAVAVYIWHCRTRKQMVSFPCPPKCDGIPVPLYSPPRYVPSPRHTRIPEVSFAQYPELPITPAPSLYVSQEDLHV